nr:PRC-barrel domain-containing protein [uncultured Bacillus sp.]
MRTFSLLKGLPIYELKTGTKIGEVCDLCVSSKGMVKGLLVKKGVLFKKNFFISVQNVSSFGFDGVMIEDREVLETLQIPEHYTIENKQRLLGRMMMTAEGERLGFLEDVYFLEEVGTIIGYEISDGFFSDMMEGKRVIKAEQPPAIGKDAIIVNVK